MYSAEQCQRGFFAWSHESTDRLKNRRKAHGELEREQSLNASPAENGIYHVNMTSWGLPSATHAHRVGSEAASEQAATSLRETRVLLLRSKKWTKSSTTKNRTAFSGGVARGRRPLTLPWFNCVEDTPRYSVVLRRKKRAHPKNVFGGLQPPIPRFAKRQTA